MTDESMPDEERDAAAGSESSVIPAAAVSESPVKPVAAEAKPSPSQQAGSRTGRFLRRALRWVTALIVIFGLGVAAMWFFRVRLLEEELGKLEQSVSDLGAARDELQARVDELDSVEAHNELLAGALRKTEIRVALLDVLVDISRAQLAIEQDEPLAVLAALEDTDQLLIGLGILLEPDRGSEIQSLQERLVLVIYEVEDDRFAAQRDLEILANLLLAMETELFER